MEDRERQLTSRIAWMQQQLGSGAAPALGVGSGGGGDADPLSLSTSFAGAAGVSNAAARAQAMMQDEQRRLTSAAQTTVASLRALVDRKNETIKG